MEGSRRRLFLAAFAGVVVMGSTLELPIGSSRVGGSLASTASAQTCPVTISDEWDGGGSDKKWTTGANWVDNTAPTTNEVCLHLPTISGHQACDFDHDGVVGVVTIFGSSPTVFGFNVINEPFRPDLLNLWGFVLLDADDCTEVRGDWTTLQGSQEVNVASGVACWLSDLDIQTQYTVLKVIGTVDGDYMYIDAAADFAHRGLTVKGGGTLDVNRIYLYAMHATQFSAYIASLTVEAGALTTNELHAHAGQSLDRRVAIDVQDSLIVKNKTFFEEIELTGAGRIAIDISAGKEFDMGELIVTGPTVITFTGGSSTTPGKCFSSASEGASDETGGCS